MDKLTSEFNKLNVKKLGPSARAKNKAHAALSIRQKNYYKKKGTTKTEHLKKSKKTKKVRRNSTDTALKDIMNILKIS